RSVSLPDSCSARRRQWRSSSSIDDCASSRRSSTTSSCRCSPSFRTWTTCRTSRADDTRETQMSRIYDALKKLQAEGRQSPAHRRGGGGGSNGSGGNGNANGSGNGRRSWRPWPFRRGRGGKDKAPPSAINFELGPEVEEAYQRLGTNLLVSPGQPATDHPRLLGVVASRHGEGATTTSAVFASILVRRRGGRGVGVEANLRSPSLETAF